MGNSSRERVVVTGMGAVTPLGHDVASTWSSLVAGCSGAAPIALFDASSFGIRFACEVKAWDPTPFIARKKLKELDRFTEFALAAAAMAIEDASLSLAAHEEERAGCFIGVGLGGLASLETAAKTLFEKGPSKLSPYTIPRIIANLAAGQVSIAHGLRGPSFATTSACATGAHAIGEAAEWIRRGSADVMVAGGAESTITPIGIGGFQAMHALSRRNDAPERASRPFDCARDGFVCGEGGGVVVLESLTRARRRGARIYAELSGYGASSDAFHITGPAPEGEGCQRAMRMALDDAGLSPDAIDHLNAHATSTSVGDKAESDGILHVFGAHARDGKLAVSATKSMTGHLLGAAGAVEAIFTVLAIREGVMPPTINVEEQDPECPLDIVPNVARAGVVRHAMSNGFGFGGTNATLVFSRL
ncbi:beta-ketoacyl-ACP synthase II [Pendulispora rubella]|uniref:3-oxoacyl-[acyl-carrier-protein] synthase 2 n=1 Tax=Pendulispora rubella TaxID=2741070 RepID=A0ABZ2KPR6_9BACT